MPTKTREPESIVEMRRKRGLLQDKIVEKKAEGNYLDKSPQEQAKYDSLVAVLSDLERLLEHFDTL